MALRLTAAAARLLSVARIANTGLSRAAAVTLVALSLLSWTGKSEAAPDLSGLLAILAGTPQGEWVRVNLNEFQDVWTPIALQPPGLLGNTQAIIGAWSSYAWDSNRGDLILYGGGHANYSGNEVYRWHGTTQLWERGSLPTDGTVDALAVWLGKDGPDAAPAAAHTYDNNMFLPIVDRFVAFGGAAWNNGGPYLRHVTPTTYRFTGPYFFDPSRADPNKVGGTTGSQVDPTIVGGNMWANRDVLANIPGIVYIDGIPECFADHVNGVTAYARENGKDVVYVRANGGGGGTDMQLYRYVVNDIASPSADTCEHVGQWWSNPGNMGAGTYDPIQKVFLALGIDTAPFFYWNLNTSGPTNKDVGIIPADPGGQFAAALSTTEIRNYGMDFDPIRRKYMLWGGGGTVWALTPPPTVTPAGWAVAREPVPAMATPTADIGTGVLGKWKYIANLDAFMALQDADAGNVWLWKPIGWINPATHAPPVVTLTAPASARVYTAPANVTLTAAASDSAGIARVAFYAGATKLGEANAPPYTLTWVGAPAGSYSLTARAVDNLGAFSDSSPVVITVNAVPVTPQFALYRPSINRYFIDFDFDHVSDLNVTFGAPGDIGLAGRFDADKISDLVVYRSNGLWLADTHRDGIVDATVGFGGVPGDQPLLADMNGDGRDDLIIYRGGMWYVSTARNGIADLTYAFGGAPGDVALAGDVDGDGNVDLVIYRNGLWFIDTNRDGIADIVVGFGGLPGDVPLLFDWDGDGKADLCIYRNGTWIVNTRLDGTAQVIFPWGAPGDLPLTGVFR